MVAIHSCDIPVSGESDVAITTVFINNRTQAVRLPAEARLPEGTRQVTVRARGKERHRAARIDLGQLFPERSLRE